MSNGNTNMNEAQRRFRELDVIGRPEQELSQVRQDGNTKTGSVRVTKVERESDVVSKPKEYMEAKANRAKAGTNRAKAGTNRAKSGAEKNPIVNSLIFNDEYKENATITIHLSKPYDKREKYKHKHFGFILVNHTQFLIIKGIEENSIAIDINNIEDIVGFRIVKVNGVPVNNINDFEEIISDKENVIIKIVKVL